MPDSSYIQVKCTIPGKCFCNKKQKSTKNKENWLIYNQQTEEFIIYNLFLSSSNKVHPSVVLSIIVILTLCYVYSLVIQKPNSNKVFLSYLIADKEACTWASFTLKVSSVGTLIASYSHGWSVTSGLGVRYGDSDKYRSRSVISQFTKLSFL